MRNYEFCTLVLVAKISKSGKAIFLSARIATLGLLLAGEFCFTVQSQLNYFLRQVNYENITGQNVTKNINRITRSTFELNAGRFK
jgi:hypothetical protein